MKLNLFFTEGVSLFTWYQTGMLARELALYRQLMEKDVSVKFVTYGNRSDHRFVAQLDGIALHTNDLNLPLEWYQRKLEIWPPEGEIFKSNQMAGADVCLASARRAGGKFVARCGYLLSDFQAHKHGENSSSFAEARELEQKVFAEADQIIVTTAKMKNTVVEAYKIEAPGIHVIPNYVETDRFRPVVRDPNERLRIGFVGRLDTQKNIPALLEAVRDLDVELHLVGYGPLRSELESQSAGSRAKIFFRGSLQNTQLPEFLNSCDIFVLPSLYEGHPKALLEAMSVGLPVVGTKVPGIVELLDDGKTGLLCETNPVSLRAGIEKLLEDQELRGNLGEAARQLILNDFSLDQVVDLELNVLNSALDN